MDKQTLNKYLHVLSNLRLVEREIPVTEEMPQKSRKGLYRITDNFFVFWFQYIFPYKSYLEMGNFDYVIDKIFNSVGYKDSANSSFKMLAAAVYERVSIERLIYLSPNFFPLEKVNRWWNREQEIDLVGINSKEKKIIFGECKWSEKQVGTNIFEDLKEKAKLVDWNLGKRQEYYILFSKSGFTSAMKKLAKEEKIFLVEGDKLIR